MTINKLFIAGAGLMGSGIAQMSAAAGFDVMVREITDEFLTTGLGKVTARMEKAVAKGRLEVAEKDAILSRISGTTELAGLVDCDLIIEAVTENVELKQEVLTGDFLVEKYLIDLKSISHIL